MQIVTECVPHKMAPRISTCIITNRIRHQQTLNLNFSITKCASQTAAAHVLKHNKHRKVTLVKVEPCGAAALCQYSRTPFRALVSIRGSWRVIVLWGLGCTRGSSDSVTSNFTLMYSLSCLYLVQQKWTLAAVGSCWMTVHFLKSRSHKHAVNGPT